MVRFPSGLLALVCVALLGAACVGDELPSATSDTGSAALRVAVVEESLRPPGTALAIGVEVQAGSLLVGMPIPLIDLYPASGASPVPSGWQALLVVDGDPIDVWDRYAEHLGVAAAAGARRSCVVSAIVEPTKGTTGEGYVAPARRFITDTPLGGENRVQCSATVGGTTMLLAVGAAPCLGSRCALHSASHLYISVRESPAEDGSEQFGTDELRYERASEAADDPDAVTEPLPVPVGRVFAPELAGEFPSHLPKPGQRIDDGLDYFLNGASVGLVPDAGRSLVAPAMLIECNSGLVALLEIAGSPSEAVAMFDGGDHVRAVVHGTDGEGGRWAVGGIASAGGYEMDLVALQTGEDASVVLVTECGD